MKKHLVLIIGFAVVVLMYQNCGNVNLSKKLSSNPHGPEGCRETLESYPSHIAVGLDPNDASLLKAFVIEQSTDSNELTESTRLYDWSVEYIGNISDFPQVSVIPITPFSDTDTSCEVKTIRAISNVCDEVTELPVYRYENPNCQTPTQRPTPIPEEPDPVEPPPPPTGEVIPGTNSPGEMCSVSGSSTDPSLEPPVDPACQNIVKWRKTIDGQTLNEVTEVRGILGQGVTLSRDLFWTYAQGSTSLCAAGSYSTFHKLRQNQFVSIRMNTTSLGVWPFSYPDGTVPYYTIPKIFSVSKCPGDFGATIETTGSGIRRITGGEGTRGACGQIATFTELSIQVVRDINNIPGYRSGACYVQQGEPYYLNIIYVDATTSSNINPFVTSCPISNGCELSGRFSGFQCASQCVNGKTWYGNTVQTAEYNQTLSYNPGCYYKVTNTNCTGGY